MNHKITKIRRKMMTELDKDRYEHTLGVMYTAASLAMRYDEDIEKALKMSLRRHEDQALQKISSQYIRC